MKMKILNYALDNALARYANIVGEPFPCVPIRSFIESEVFIAIAIPDGESVKIRVSTGVVDALKNLWQKAIKLSDTLPEENRFNVEHVDYAVDTSLTWLMLHELHHHAAGHLKLVGSAGISETILQSNLGLTSRSSHKPSKLKSMSKSQTLSILRCFELQADHEALELMIDGYSDEGWQYVRFYMTCAIAVMVLIDKHDQDYDNERTHPAAATRTFQMFGVMAMRWKPASADNRDIPNDDEVESFYRAVVAPAVTDYSILARAIRAKAIIYSQQDVDDLLSDIKTLGEISDPNLKKYRTDGGREYASLMPTNKKVLELLENEK